MARWQVTPGTVGNTMAGSIQYGDIGDNTYWEIKQDVSDIKKEVQRDRDLLATGRHNKFGMRKMATIPDVIAIEMLTKHGLDIHDPMFMDNPNNMKRLRYLLTTEYPELLIST